MHPLSFTNNATKQKRKDMIAYIAIQLKQIYKVLNTKSIIQDRLHIQLQQYSLLQQFFLKYNTTIFHYPNFLTVYGIEYTLTIPLLTIAKSCFELTLLQQKLINPTKIIIIQMPILFITSRITTKIYLIRDIANQKNKLFKFPMTIDQ